MLVVSFIPHGSAKPVEDCYKAHLNGVFGSVRHSLAMKAQMRVPCAVSEDLSGYRLNSSRRRLVWARLTGISVWRLSFMRNW